MRETEFFKWLKSNFIGKIVKQRPPNMEISDFLNIVFRVDYRSITEATSTETLKMSGKYLNHSIHPISGYKMRTFRKGTKFLIRNDAADKFVDIEVKGEVFRIKKSEYEQNYKPFFRFYR